MSEVAGAVQTPSFEKTWGSSTSSGYCSEEDSDSELEQYFTARTSFFHKPRKQKVEEKKVRLFGDLTTVLAHSTQLPFFASRHFLKSYCTFLC